MKVLMVCLGNICRSPIAEGVLQYKAKQAGLKWEVDSAGTLGFHAGSAPHPLSQKVAMENGIDISYQKARPLTAIDFEQFDLLYAMDNSILADMRRIAGQLFDEKKVKLFLEELYPGQFKDLTDPYNGPESGFRKVYDLICDTCDNIIQRHSNTSSN
jgi:protein-tyrosine phosphatase